ncbi:hypothetical protein BH10PSE6_BH10PSE6_43520 [soil metagenome]
MLKSALIGIALVVCATPVLAFNGPDNNPNTTRTAPLPGGTNAYPVNSPCQKAAKAPLTAEQRAQKQAMRQQRAAERVAQGLPAKAPKDPAARKQRSRSC